MRANIIILTCLFLLPAIFGNSEKNDTQFVPTHEWQTVNKGMSIPKGLHVRHSFKTGVTEAKLMDPEEVKEKDTNVNLKISNTNSLTLHPEKAIPEEKEPATTKKTDLFNHSTKELKARLKKVKQDGGENVPELNDEHAQQVKQKFYETLKKEFKSIVVNVTTDTDLLSNYLQKFQPHKTGIIMGTLTATEIEEVLDILYNLEFLLHYIDNAKIFADMDGMNKVISPCLNGTNNEIKAEALRLLGAAVQSNPKVQLNALKNDIVQKLLHILSTNNKVEVKSRCMYALSALIRQFPTAQKVWIDHGGVEIFGKLLVDDQTQVQIKVMKLINDLIIERQNLGEITDVMIAAYASADIEKKLLTYEYCNHLGNLLLTYFKGDKSKSLSNDNYEFLQTINDSIITVTPICMDHFKEIKGELVLLMKRLLSFYDLNLQVGKVLLDESRRDEL